jgi:diketogulonate reductase-like aldo/keto reductase
LLIAAVAHSQKPTIPIRALHGSIEMPLAGTGTWLYNDSQAEYTVGEALKLGVRLIDTANTYGNQVGVGKAIKASGINRKELFITSKVPGGLDYQDTTAAAEQNLQQLGVDYVDLLLVHFPCSMTNPPKNCTKAARQTTWHALEAQVFTGKARAIGVSHYCQKQLEDILEIATVPIAANQEEWHVGMGTDPSGVVSFCKQHGISYQSFSPLCGPCGNQSSVLIDGPLVTKIGKKHGKSGPQVALKWLVQQGSPVIPKSHNVEHIQQDFDVLSWSLSHAEMAELSTSTSPPSIEPVSGDCQLPTQVVV